AARASADPAVDRVIICTPDKDLAQSVRGTRVVQLNRRTNVIRDETGVIAKFGVPPESLPDYLALVGDSADGYPGLPGWGPKSSAPGLARFAHLAHIPEDWSTCAGRARAIRASRAHLGGLAQVVGQRLQRGGAGSHAETRARPRLPLQRPR